MEEDIEAIRAYLKLLSFKSPFAKLWTNLLTRLNVILSTKISKLSPKLAAIQLSIAQNIVDMLSNIALNPADRAFLAGLSIEISHLKEKLEGGNKNV